MTHHYEVGQTLWRVETSRVANLPVYIEVEQYEIVRVSDASIWLIQKIDQSTSAHTKPLRRAIKRKVPWAEHSPYDAMVSFLTRQHLRKNYLEQAQEDTHILIYTASRWIENNERDSKPTVIDE